MQRVLQNTPATISNTWYEDGVAVDPGTVTLDITGSDGTVLVNDGATGGSGAAARTYNLSATTETNQLDLLTVTWTSTTKGTMTDYVEVVGGFLFPLSELSAKLANASGTYTAAQMTDARTYAETVIEDACGVAFVPRYRLETVNGSGESLLVLDFPRIRSVRASTADGEAVTDTITVLSDGTLYSTGTWSSGYGNVVIGYEHGYDFPPADVAQAALALAKFRLVEGPIDARVTTMTDEYGTWALSTPGQRGAVTGLPEVDAVIERYAVANVGVG